MILFTKECKFNFIQLWFSFSWDVVFLCLNPKSFQPSCQAFPSTKHAPWCRLWVARSPRLALKGSSQRLVHVKDASLFNKEAWQIPYSTYFNVSYIYIYTNHVYIYIIYIYIHMNYYILYCVILNYSIHDHGWFAKPYRCSMSIFSRCSRVMVNLDA